MQLPTYQGPTLQPAHTHHTQAAVQNPLDSTFAQSAAVATRAAYNLESTLRENQEYTLEQNRAAALQRATVSLNEEMTRRLNIADGQKDSLFNADGIIIQAEVDAIKARYRDIANSWTTGFTSPQGLASAQEAQQKYRTAVHQAIDAKLAIAAKPRALNALKNNVQACIAAGDFISAGQHVDQAQARGLISDAEHYVEQNEILKQQIGSDIASSQTAQDLQSVLDNPNYQHYFHANPSTRAKIIDKQNSLNRYKATPPKVELIEAQDPATAQPATEQGATTKSTKKKQYRIIPAQAPESAPPYIRSHFQIFPDLTTPEAQQASRALLAAEISKQDPTSKEAEYAMETLAESLQLPKGALEDAWAKHLETFENPETKFNPKEQVQLWLNSYQGYTNLQLADAGILTKQEVFRDYNDKQIIANLTAQNTLLKGALNRALEEFQAWHNLNPKATPIQQAEQFDRLARYNIHMFSRNKGDSAPQLAGMATFSDWLKSYKAPAERAAVDADLRTHQNAKTTRKQQNLANVQQRVKARIDRYNVHNLSKNAYANFHKVYPTLDISRPTHRTIAALNLLQNHILPQQAATVSLDTPIAPPATAAALPNTDTHHILYVPQDADIPTEYLYLPYDDDCLQLAIVKTDAVSTPAFSVKTAKRLGFHNKSYNHIIFANNNLTLLQLPASQSKLPTSNFQPPTSEDGYYVAEDGLLTPSDILYDENGNPTLFPADEHGNPVGPDGKPLNQ